MRFTRHLVAFCCLLALAATLAACGGSDETESTATSQPAPAAAEFPDAQGKTLRELLDTCYPDRPAKEQACAPAQEANVVVSPASQVFYKGPNRVSFGAFQVDRKPINDAQISLYFARVPPTAPSTGDSTGSGDFDSAGQDEGEEAPASAANALDQPAIGPFPARVDQIETEAAFRSETSSQDPFSATSVYTSNVNFPENGDWTIAAVVRKDDELFATLIGNAAVGQFTGIPRVGDRPPRIHTPTPEDVGGDLSKLTTRVPPENQSDVDFYDVLGKDPVILLFATPQFCQSRVCGPVVDVAEQVKESSPGDVKFIHMEIFNNNEPNDGIRPQVKAFKLPSEPWLFAIDRNGVVQEAIEGAFSVRELEQAVGKVSG